MVSATFAKSDTCPTSSHRHAMQCSNRQTTLVQLILRENQPSSFPIHDGPQKRVQHKQPPRPLEDSLINFVHQIQQHVSTAPARRRCPRLLAPSSPFRRRRNPTSSTLYRRWRRCRLWSRSGLFCPCGWCRRCWRCGLRHGRVPVVPILAFTRRLCCRCRRGCFCCC